MNPVALLSVLPPEVRPNAIRWLESGKWAPSGPVLGVPDPADWEDRLWRKVLDTVWSPPAPPRVAIAWILKTFGQRGIFALARVVPLLRPTDDASATRWERVQEALLFRHANGPYVRWQAAILAKAESPSAALARAWVDLDQRWEGSVALQELYALTGDERWGAAARDWRESAGGDPRSTTGLHATGFVDPPVEISATEAATLWSSLHRDRGREEKLWSIIQRDWTDLTPRHVLADHFLDIGDPRGPFWAEQLASGEPGFSPLSDLRFQLTSPLGMEPPYLWRNGVVTGCTGTSLWRLESPPWRGIEVLHLPGDTGHLVGPMNLPHLRALGLSEATPTARVSCERLALVFGPRLRTAYGVADIAAAWGAPVGTWTTRNW